MEKIKWGTSGNSVQGITLIIICGFILYIMPEKKFWSVLWAALWVLAAIGGFFMMDYMWQTFFEKDYIKYKKRREKKTNDKKTNDEEINYQKYLREKMELESELNKNIRNLILFQNFSERLITILNELILCVKKNETPSEKLNDDLAKQIKFYTYYEKIDVIEENYLEGRKWGSKNNIYEVLEELGLIYNTAYGLKDMYEATHLESEDLKSIEVYKTGIKHFQSMIDESEKIIYKRKGQNRSILMLKREKFNIKKQYHN